MNSPKNIFSLLIAVMIALGFSSCGNDDGCCPAPPPGSTLNGDVWVVNEGQFQAGNSTLGLYNSTTGTYVDKAFSITNNRDLGDVLQSITFHNNKAYLFVNGSQRIEVISASDYKSINTITESIYSPRYGVIYQDRMYISDLSRPYIYILDPVTDAIIDSIFTTVPVEEMILHNGTIFAGAMSFTKVRDKLYVIDIAERSVVDSIQVADNPTAMVSDKDDNIWVMCEGSFGVDNSNGLYRINPTSRIVEQTFDLTNFIPQYPTRLAVNTAEAVEILINGGNGIYSVDIDATTFPISPQILIAENSYGLGINPKNGNIYVGDAAGFAGIGNLAVYTNDRLLIQSVSTGFAPARFYFR